ncbi:MAG: GerMN domain-containing protein [Clostridiales bacterium]
MKKSYIKSNFSIFILCCLMILSLTVLGGCTKTKDNAQYNTPNHAMMPTQNKTGNIIQNTGANMKYKVYFANGQHSALVGEERQYTHDYGKNGSIGEMAKESLEALIAGPGEALNKATLTGTAMINSIKQEGEDILHVDFKDGFIDGYKDLGTTPEMTVHSIVSTLTENPQIKQVRITVNGRPLTIDNTTYGEPLTRNEALIKK